MVYQHCHHSRHVVQQVGRHGQCAADSSHVKCKDRKNSNFSLSTKSLGLPNSAPYAPPLQAACTGLAMAEFGRPKLFVDKEKLEFLRSLHFTWEEVSAILKVSVKTLQRKGESGIFSLILQ